MNRERNAFVVKEWKHQHNHNPLKVKKPKKSWEQKFADRMSGKKKERKGKNQKKTLEESVVDEYVKVLSEWIIDNPDNLPEKLNLIKNCGEKIAEMDGKKDQITFPKVDSSEDEEGNISEIENEENTHEEEIEINNVAENIAILGVQNNSEEERLTRRDKKKKTRRKEKRKKEKAEGR
ncbi:protein MNN4-like [Cotesia glomerata]|uniref:protein MNN4-like n=1 Tax=Cotesia glomerata TaxID=32391 RepID=UPI001D02A666|nr:protein MNN4-like [Cotesia glomerata]